MNRQALGTIFCHWDHQLISIHALVHLLEDRYTFLQNIMNIRRAVIVTAKWLLCLIVLPIQIFYLLVRIAIIGFVSPLGRTSGRWVGSGFFGFGSCFSIIPPPPPHFLLFLILFLLLLLLLLYFCSLSSAGLIRFLLLLPRCHSRVYPFQKVLVSADRCAFGSTLCVYQKCMLQRLAVKVVCYELDGSKMTLDASCHHHMDMLWRIECGNFLECLTNQIILPKEREHNWAQRHWSWLHLAMPNSVYWSAEANSSRKCTNRCIAGCWSWVAAMP